MKKLLICLLVLMMAVPAALAETVTLDGTVVSTQTIPVMSPVDGALSYVYWREGDHVAAGEDAAALYAIGQYADQSGTVRVMGAEGESLEALQSRYGGVLYIEPDCEYTVSASTRNAYDEIENKIIHPGETVYVRNSNGSHEGVGRVTTVSGTSYAIDVTEGVFKSGESVTVYRDSSYDAKSRLGKGTVSHASPVAYTGVSAAAETVTGRVFSIAVKDGAHVNTGDLLFRTVETAYTHRIISETSGTVATVYVAPGDVVAQGTLIADVYPDEAMRLEMSVSENDLRYVHVGTRVTIEFTSGETAEGEIERISAVAQAPAATAEVTDETAAEIIGDEDVCFSAYVRFDAPATVRYGMTAKITTLED